MTPIDAAHAAMLADPDSDPLRLAFHARLAEAELFLLLDHDGDPPTPRVFDLDDGPVVLVFDREDRLAAFAEGPAPYAAMPGRAAVLALAGQGIALGVNLGVAPSSYLLSPDGVDWLAGTLARAPDEAEARAVAFDPPGALPEALLAALDRALARAAGLARAALLGGVRYADGRRGHLLAFLGAAAGAAPPLARAVADALTFSGIEAGELDVVFLDDGDPRAARLAQVALRFDLAAATAAPAAPPPAPGSDPDRPPILR